MRRNAHVRFGGRAEETDGWKHPHGAPARPYTYVHTREGWMYVSFLQDGFSRRILGFTVAASKTVELVTRTLVQAVSVRRRSNLDFVADGVIVHSDAGSQYTSLSFTEKLLDLGLAGSVGRVGTEYDNALIESTIGLYKTELVHRRSRKAGLKKRVVLYSGRHTTGTLMHESGTPLKVISTVLGYTDVNTTAGTYVHESPNLTRRVMGEFWEHLNAQHPGPARVGTDPGTMPN